MQWNIKILARAALCCGLLYGKIVIPLMAADSAETPNPVSTPPVELGTWVWKAESIDDPAKGKSLLEFCKQRGIDRLLVQIHFVGDAQEIDGAARLRDFLQAAAKSSIKVEALDGGPEMGFEARREQTLRRLALILALHNSQPDGNGFVGVHYDIEPYGSERWKKGDLQGVALETLVTMSAIQRKIKETSPGLTIAYDIPSWYDKKEELVLTYGGSHQNFHRHIQDLSDYVGVMSYRRAATGSNSVTEISKPMLAYAAATGKKVYVSLETVPLKTDAQISFNETSADSFLHTIDQLRGELGGSPGFGGILLHDYVHVRRLLESSSTQPSFEPSAHP